MTRSYKIQQVVHFALIPNVLLFKNQVLPFLNSVLMFVIQGAKVMCTDYIDIKNDGRTILHIASNQASAHNDSDINASQWYRFVDQGTKEPMKVCSFCFKWRF